MLFVITCLDRPDSASLRLATRPAHLEFLGTEPSVLLGGPFLDDDGGMIGSMIVLDASDETEAQAFASADPYANAGLFASTTIRAWRQTVGSRSLGL